MRWTTLSAVAGLLGLAACGGGGGGDPGGAGNGDVGFVCVTYFPENFSCQGHSPIRHLRVRNSDTEQDWEFPLDLSLACHERIPLDVFPLGHTYVLYWIVEGGSGESFQLFYSVLPGENEWTIY